MSHTYVPLSTRNVIKGHHGDRIAQLQHSSTNALKVWDRSSASLLHTAGIGIGFLHRQDDATYDVVPLPTHEVNASDISARGRDIRLPTRYRKNR